MANLISNTKRLNKILEITKNEGRIKISALSNLFNVTKMTIYRDLKKLEEDNKLILVKKGAIYINNKTTEYPHYLRYKKNKIEKELIAKKTISYINDNETIFLDGSTTVLQLARLISKESYLHITIITSSPIIINELIENRNIQLICIGGTLNKTNFEFYGNYTRDFIKDIKIKKIFLSCSGFSIKNGFTETIKEEETLKKILIENCNEINILADHTKYNIVSAYTFADFNIAKRMITDNKLDPKNLKELKKSKVEIVVAE